MTPICITGSAPLPAQTLATLVAQGLTQATPLPRDPQINFQSWHSKVLTPKSSATPSAVKPVARPIARMWEQLAAELLLAHADHPAWAWAEPDSLHLLDFWATFDHSIRFLLLAEHPAQTLQRLMAETARPHNPELDSANILAQWQSQHQKLLHFALRHADRCQLIWADQAQNHPLDLAQHLTEQWALDWQPLTTPAQAAPVSCPLAQHLAQQIVEQHPQPKRCRRCWTV